MVEPIRKSFVVDATAERAFRVFTAEHGAWWPLATHHIGAQAAEIAVIEPRAGGRWFEIGEDGQECNWGKVLAWEPPARLLLAWQIDGNWKYDPDLVTEVEVTFTPLGKDTTRVDLEHRNLERFGDKVEPVRKAIDSDGGWTQIMKSYADACSL